MLIMDFSSKRSLYCCCFIKPPPLPRLLLLLRTNDERLWLSLMDECCGFNALEGLLLLLLMLLVLCLVLVAVVVGTGDESDDEAGLCRKFDFSADELSDVERRKGVSSFWRSSSDSS